ncbi:citryl-CoA lyase [Jiangella mangrovi]|uniref:citrate synthase (unknown stereospecificity) n=1 Tax=Jiangella mangrovi TaxID=1524084 RepID=A0A7W9GT02_9ACTN|nr:citrate synthase [Jiangella mangrovi]
MTNGEPDGVTRLGYAFGDRVQVHGYDLTEELLGSVSFTDMVGLLLTGSWPTASQRRLLDALLVVLIEHGMVAPVAVARLTYKNSPESLQGAVAASLLGAGSKHLGSSELCAHDLVAALDHGDTVAEQARWLVADALGGCRYVYGVGHSTHTEGDPRARRLFEIAEEEGVAGHQCALLREVRDELQRRTGKDRPVNVTGAIAAISLDLGLPWQITKSFALIGRCLGSLAHIREELENPLGPRLKRLLKDVATYEPPARVGSPAQEGSPAGPTKETTWTQD